MTTALAVIQSDELEVIQRTGKLLAVSGYFDGKGESPQAIAMMATKILAGREIGIGPFAAVNGIHIISGKPAVGANLMASAVKSSGRYDYRVQELTDKLCRIEFRQRMGDKWEVIGISEFNADDARKAGTKNMDKFPKNMLFARAMSNGVRFYTPDIFSGNAVYVPEELGAEVDGDGNVVEATFTVEKPDPDASAVSQKQAAASEPSDCQKLREWASNLHRKADAEPCTDKQYQYLSGLIDTLAGKDTHRAVLSHLCSAEITSSLVPARKVAVGLIDALSTASNNYNVNVVACIKAIGTGIKEQPEDGNPFDA